MRQALEIWTCDICGIKTPPTKDQPKGWAVIKVESPYDDRSFSDRTICPTCIGLIQRATPTK